MSEQKSRKQAGELRSLYFEITDYIDELPEHPNFERAREHLRCAYVWAQEGIGIVNKIDKTID